MKVIAKAIQSLVVRILSHLSLMVLERLESVISQANGKGYGTSTIKQEVYLFSKAIKSVGIDSPTLIDLGGGVGLWSLEFRKKYPASKIHIFEPSSTAFAKPKLSTKYAENISIYKLAVDVKPGSRKLYSDEPGSGMASLYERKLDHVGIDVSHSEVVECVNLDDFLTDNRITSDCLKIDVEGHELKILNSISNLGAKFRIILFEFGGTHIDSRTFFQDFWYFFQTNNYQLFRVTPSGSRRISHYSESLESFRATNYIAVHQGQST
jgi:FkbM family methyltransferase